MKNLSALIVEDNSLISEDMATQMTACGYNVVGQAYDYTEAIDLMETKKPDIILLDIQLAGVMDGIEIANYINHHIKKPFLYITSYSDPATLRKVQGTNPHGYLLKPFDNKALRANIELALHRYDKSKNQSQTPAMDAAVFVKVKNSLVKIDISDLLYAEAYDNYCYIKTASQKYLVSHTLKSVEEKLIHHGFMRVHRAYLVNLTKIQAVTECSVIIDRDSIPVGRSYRDELLSLLNTL